MTDDEAVSLVKRVVVYGSSVNTIGDVWLAQLGDQAARIAGALIGCRPVGDTIVRRIILLARKAFADVARIQTLSDRDPNITRELLRNLASGTSDESLKKQIGELLQVLGQYGSGT